jgi:hypothetical protein
MENKKLLKYLLKDLSELDEMFSEEGKNSFDNLEIEFIQNRISGAKKLVQLIIDHENEVHAENQTAALKDEKTLIQNTPVMKEKTITPTGEKQPGNRWVETESTIKTDEIESEPVKTNTLTETPQNVNRISSPVQGELQLDDEEPVDIHHKRLGDSFTKEKSVNDLMGDDYSNLEHKLSNRPISSIQAAIGINDRFQFIRELFEGSADNFTKTVTDLDSMNDIQQAVSYLQTHFKWKKNETSLKFVNLIKRRFPNE